MWRGLQAITDYKPKPAVINTSDSLPDELNNFFARFETHNTDPVTPVRGTPGAVELQVTQRDVSKTFKSVGTHKAAGPDGIASRVLKLCYDQLSGVFTDIFNMSLSLCVVPLCFKETIIVPIQRKNLSPVLMIIALWL